VTVLAGTPGCRLLLGDSPVHAVASVTVNGRLLTPSQHRWSPRGFLYRDAGWGDTTTDATIVWDHGSDVVPPAIASVAATRLLAAPDRLTRLDVEGYSYAANEFGFTLAELTVLNRYRRRCWP
jgi:hypothetical protein